VVLGRTTSQISLLQKYLQKTYRVRGIPHLCNRKETEKIIKAALGLEHENPSFALHSLAANPYRPQQEKVATLTFTRIPSCLCSSKNETQWCFTIPSLQPPQANDKDADDDTFRRATEIVLDNHFRGFTPLSSFRSTSDHRFEYVVLCNAMKIISHSISCIAISGLGGHAFGSFKERGKPYMWLRDSLPDDLPGARILIYGYNTELQKNQSFQSLRNLANQFRNDLRAIRGKATVSRVNTHHNIC